MERPFFSLITPVYNVERLLSMTIESVLWHTRGEKLCGIQNYIQEMDAKVNAERLRKLIDKTKRGEDSLYSGDLCSEG